MGEHQVCLNLGRSGTLEAAEPDRLATHQVVTAQQRVWDKMGMGDCGNALASPGTGWERAMAVVPALDRGSGHVPGLCRCGREGKDFCQDRSPDERFFFSHCLQTSSSCI